MSDRRVFRWATTSTRMLIGTVVSVAAVVAVVTAISLPWPTLAREPATVVVAPAPAAAVITCSGGLVSPGRDLDNVGALSLVAPQDVVFGVEEGAVPPESTLLAAGELGGFEGPLTFTAAPHDGERTDVAASGSASISEEDLSGYAASACRPPLLESWIVGGSATTGSADFVLLANPGSVASTVQLTVFGAEGPQVPPGGADLVIAARSQRIIPLAGLALGEAAPVIRVTAVGSPVQASVQASITRTLLPGGVEQVGALPSLEASQRIVGVEVTMVSGDTGATSAATIARVLSPSRDSSAVVTVRALGASEPAREPATVPLAAGIPTEVDLGGLPVGRYIVDIAAESPVAAAVWQTTGFGEGADFAWYTPSPLLEKPALIVAPPGPQSQLTLVNTADEPATTTVTSLDGSMTLQVDIPAGASAGAVLQPRGVYVVTPDAAGVHAALSMTGEGALAGFPVWPADAAAPPVTVYP